MTNELYEKILRNIERKYFVVRYKNLPDITKEDAIRMMLLKQDAYSYFGGERLDYVMDSNDIKELIENQQNRITELQKVIDDYEAKVINKPDLLVLAHRIRTLEAQLKQKEGEIFHLNLLEEIAEKERQSTPISEVPWRERIEIYEMDYEGNRGVNIFFETHDGQTFSGQTKNFQMFLLMAKI